MRLHSIYEITCHGCGRLIYIERDNTDTPCPHCKVTIRCRWGATTRRQSLADHQRHALAVRLKLRGRAS